MEYDMPQVFDRYEVKYVLPIDLADQFRASLMANGMVYDKFNLHQQRYRIRSIYYGELPEIVESHKVPFEKRIFNQRIRVRSYGSVKNDEVFLEIKKKFNGRTNKRRTTLDYEDYEDVLEESPQADESQVTREAKYLMMKKQMQPYLYLAYDRLAFKGAEDSDLRISFDANIRSRSTELDLKQDTNNTYLIDPSIEIMEIKTAYGVPNWLNELLEKFQLRPQKYSKFMKATGLKERD